MHARKAAGFQLLAGNASVYISDDSSMVLLEAGLQQPAT
jgi:hypothetical protein